MSHIFISHVEEDKEIAIRIAEELEKAGYKTWYYERDSIGGVSHIDQTSQAIREGDAVLLIASAEALESNEIDLELYAAHRNNKNIIPVLVNITYEQLQNRRPRWDAIFRGAVAIRYSPESVSDVVDRIVRGMRALNIQPAVPIYDTRVSQDELKVLQFIRRSPDRVSLKEIAAKTMLPDEKTRKVIRNLLDNKYIKQDRRDKVKWDDNEATFFTEPSRRQEIDALLQKRLKKSL